MPKVVARAVIRPIPFQQFCSLPDSLTALLQAARSPIGDDASLLGIPVTISDNTGTGT
jgi:hypothetical protein